MSLPPELSPLARFEVEDEPVHLTGLQALARLPLDQIRRDRAAGLRTAAFISGYPGSPLAGYDQVLRRISSLLDQHDVRFELGINEELAAAAVAGSQLVDLFPHRGVDGVVGLWFGKAPGVDRCLDVFRHANFAGISRFGGALAVAGDDPGCKSSSLPSQSDHAFAHALMPVLVPENAAGVIELGLHAYALSRYAGLWTALKVVADVCDGGEIVSLPSRRTPPILPSFDRACDGQPFEKRLDPRLLPPMVLEIERDLVFDRLEAARRYVQANELDRIEGGGARCRVGFIAAGAHTRLLLSALDQLGIDSRQREQLGIRLLRLALITPLEPHRTLEFAKGLEQVVVLDDRRSLLEAQVRATLLDASRPPRVLGERDETGAPWLARRGALTPEGLARDLGPYLARVLGRPEFADRATRIAQHAEHGAQRVTARRRPHFCSGCPHLHSTQVPDGLAAAGGIGCHTMVLLTGREMRFLGAMGSEGALWNGLAPFVDTPHLIQNLGDGTYFHSGRQAIRSCVTSGSSITFKLLFNGAIAMTGGQRASGEKPLAALIRDLLSDGVRRVAAATDDPQVSGLARLDDRVECIRNADLEAVQRRLALEPGVTVLVYDEPCANEVQRQQRRGLSPPASHRVWINEDVCEGCGDCGRKSECLSVHPVETSLGRKTRIHQSTCSQDDSCVEGDCPAFLEMSGDFELDPLPCASDWAAPEEDPTLPRLDDDYSILMVGIGSTGVVTVNALLMSAARHAGLHAAHIDQTGLAQRGGRVTSHFRVSRRPIETSGHVGWGRANALLAFDPLGAADPQGLSHLSADRTHTVVRSEITPTAEMVTDSTLAVPEVAAVERDLASLSRRFDSVPAEEICTHLLGEPRAANVLMLGYAFQSGAIPLPSRAIEAAIEEHGVAAEKNRAAFRLGRAACSQRSRLPELLEGARPPAVGDGGSPQQALELYGEPWRALEALITGSGHAGTLPQLAGWALDLERYQSRGYGDRYLRSILMLMREELAQHGSQLDLTRVAARELYRLMAYKDEYEVARLLLRGPFRKWLERRCGGRIRVSYRLHPPFLRVLGLRKKVRLGTWFDPALELLASLRHLRGTVLDVFGFTRVRRCERELVRWYESLLHELARRLENLGVDRATEIAELAARVRGYEGLKLERAAQVRELAEKELARL